MFLALHRMTEVITSVEPGTEDFGGGGAGGEQDSIFPDVHERNPKLSKRLPSIVVEPTDAAEVESGELRWPPDESSSAEAQSERRSSDKHAADEEKADVGGDEEGLGVEMQDSN
ncbi:protein LBH isoform X1 [Oryzias melastigma]|nr:protein LBH isoform X1 [Oryzias melastigma]XP_024117721.1 protein LBH isoform X1 [Oryzias melastigma]